MPNQKRTLSERFVSAFELAFQLHANQMRKGSDIPYMSHLLGVASMVMEDDGDEDEVIAALLHDAVEDQGGLPTLDLIQEKFGACVASLVAFCTDTMEIPKPPWKERKLAVIQKVTLASKSEYKILLADKLHNLRTIRNAVKRYGESVWQRFKGGREGSLWYYRELLASFRARGDHPYHDEMETALYALEGDHN